jgi:hypothetical protein
LNREHSILGPEQAPIRGKGFTPGSKATTVDTTAAIMLQLAASEMGANGQVCTAKFSRRQWQKWVKTPHYRAAALMTASSTISRP